MAHLAKSACLLVAFCGLQASGLRYNPAKTPKTKATHLAINKTTNVYSPELDFIYDNPNYLEDFIATTSPAPGEEHEPGFEPAVLDAFPIPADPLPGSLVDAETGAVVVDEDVYRDLPGARITTGTPSTLGDQGPDYDAWGLPGGQGPSTTGAPEDNILDDWSDFDPWGHAVNRSRHLPTFRPPQRVQPAQAFQGGKEGDTASGVADSTLTPVSSLTPDSSLSPDSSLTGADVSRNAPAFTSAEGSSSTGAENPGWLGADSSGSSGTDSSSMSGTARSDNDNSAWVVGEGSSQPATASFSGTPAGAGSSVLGSGAESFADLSPEVQDYIADANNYLEYYNKYPEPDYTGVYGGAYARPTVRPTARPFDKRFRPTLA